MSVLDVDSIDDVGTLRNKRGHRKVWLPKAEKYIHPLLSDPLERINLQELKRFVTAFNQQRLEYESLQMRLLDILNSKETKGNLLQREQDDLAEFAPKFSTAALQMANLEDAVSTAHKISRTITATEELLQDLEEKASLLVPSAIRGMIKLNNNYESLREMEADISTDYHKEFCGAIRDFRPRIASLRDRTDEEEVAETLAKTSITVPAISKSEPSSGTSHHRERSRLPDIAIPKFTGDKTQWPFFWKTFNDVLDRDTRLNEADKISYLRQAIKTPEAEHQFAALSGERGDFDLISKKLIELYHDPRLTYKTQVKAITDAKVADRSGADELQRVASKALQILQKSGQYDADHLLTNLLEMKITGKLREDWIRTAGAQKTVPDLEELLAFLRKVGAEQRMIHSEKPRPAVQADPKSKKQDVFYTGTRPEQNSYSQQPASRPKPPCKLCNIDRHAMYFCSQFKALAVPKRKEVVQKLKLCSNCLGYGHSVQQCHSTRTCRDCNSRHHHLLHEVTPPAAVGATPTTTPATTPPQPSYMANADPAGGILPTALVNVKANGVTLTVRAVLDRCSNVSFITNSMARQLDAPRHPYKLSVGTVGDFQGIQLTELSNITVFPRDANRFDPIVVQAHISETVSMVLPKSSLAGVRNLPFLEGLDLADPSFHCPGRVDMLLGLQATATMPLSGHHTTPDRRYQADETIYGWTVVGWNPADHSQAAVYATMNKTPDNLETFWAVEGVHELDKPFSMDETQAVTHFKENLSRESDGRYVVRLPRKLPTPELGRSRQQAERRFIQNERSLKGKGKWSEFCKVVEEYKELGHAEEVPAADLTKVEQESYYLPMHGVTKDSTTTKLRVVFDASAITTNGISLNDTLLPGPNQYPLLTKMLVQFRQHRFGMTADITKMFREVGLHAADRDLHRFLWRDEEQQLTTWRMTRVTFGVTSSPFLATQTLRQLADDYQERYPRASDIVRHNFYVDDCLTGADSLEEAVAVRTELNDLLGEGKMTLRKWRSNSKALRETIPQALCETEETLLTKGAHKTLGVHWDTERDVMQLSAPDLSTDKKATKRQVASDFARTYDVMGWFSPALVIAKMVIQKLWIAKKSWDEPVPDEIETQWKQWTSELPILTKHSIPRSYYNHQKSRMNVQLHGFSDASKDAYGAVAYVRTFYYDNSTSISLVMSKTRVAPPKTLTIPKLELCGAVLLSNVLSDLQQYLSIKSEHTYAWTDSTIVLGWLNHAPGRLKVFAANRVKSITSKIEPSHWRYVPTDSNPADAASRGLMPAELIDCKLWWDGPDWLSRDPSNWPTHPQEKVTLTDVKTEIALLTIISDPPWNLANDYSTLTKLIRTTAWMKRFTCNCQLKEPSARRSNPRLTTEEMNDAELHLIKQVQKRHYSAEFKALSEKKEIAIKSPIGNLYPFVDIDGVLRVGGRLNQADQPFRFRHPAILPKKERLTRLILQNIHDTNNHAGESIMIGLLSDRFYVPGARAIFRSLTRLCISCRKVHGKNAQQLMGQLPTSRTNLSAVFSHVGVDFAGPVTTKSGNPRRPRKEKSYICLFVCMATKAVHIEVVTSLTASAFMAALHRFTSRRGLPAVVYSDNGTNFVGAASELRAAHQLLQDKNHIDQIQRELSNSKITWKHTPSRSPHFGGLWESNVKSVKNLLRKTVCQHSLTLEELSTVLCQVEATLNSRPLVPLDTLPTDGSMALTPGHFLIGRPLRVLPDLQSIKPGSHLKRWNLCQLLASSFWKEWSKTYLASLNTLNKWVRPKRNMQVGDIVLIKDQEMFLNTWPLGLIVGIHPGKDGYVRAVTVRSHKGTYERPVVKLTLLIPQNEKKPTSALEDGRA